MLRSSEGLVHRPLFNSLCGFTLITANTCAMKASSSVTFKILDTMQKLTGEFSENFMAGRTGGESWQERAVEGGGEGGQIKIPCVHVAIFNK